MGVASTMAPWRTDTLTREALHVLNNKRLRSEDIVTYPVKQQKTQQPWPSRKRVRSEKDRPTTSGHPTNISRASVLRKRRRDPDDLAYAAAEVDPYASRLRMDVRAKAQKQQHSAKKLQIIEFDQLTPKDTASSHVHHPVASGVMVPVRLPHAARSVFALLPEEGTTVPYRSQPTLRPAQPPLTIEAAPVAAQRPNACTTSCRAAWLCATRIRHSRRELCGGRGWCTDTHHTGSTGADQEGEGRRHANGGGGVSV